ncbi:adenine deaminase [Candidatus Bipolaricaulota bacterium]
MPERKPLHEMTRDLVAVAAGRRPADLVIRNGCWVNVSSGELIGSTTIAVLGCRIAYCGPDRGDLIGPNTRVIEADGRYLVPGLLDAHVHIESSMLSVRGFADAVLPHGTTGAFIDPHEIANVLGLDGVRLMVEEAKETPMQIYVQVPSCVPAAPELETTGAAIGPSEVAEALAWDNVIGLGEVMNYPGVAAGDEMLHAEIAETLKVGKTVGGHYAASDLGAQFHAYVAGGPSDCHEGTRSEDAVARVRQGMYAMLRQGSSEHNVVTQIKAITEGGLDPRHVLLCTDDRHSGTLLRVGHIDNIARMAIAEGVPAMTAIQMATLNTAEHFGVTRDVGSLAPGRYADILVVSDLETLAIDHVIAAGEAVAEKGVLLAPKKPFRYPESAKNSVKIPGTLTAEEFLISAPTGRSSANCRVIEPIANQVLTRCSLENVPIIDGFVTPAASSGISYLAVVERHSSSGRIGRGLVKGYGLTQPYGLASTVAHDSHNLLVMGTDRELMAAAANHVATMAGGICLMGGEGVLADIPLPIAGLMSEDSVAAVAERTDRLHEQLQGLGCAVEDALMSFLFLALPVIPDLRLTDLGLVDVNAFGIVPLLIEADNPEIKER